MWTHQNSDSLTSKAGEDIRFDSANSLRTRLGARFTHRLDDGFKGSQGALVDGDVMDKPEMKGSTGVLELGLTWNVKKAWTFDANIQGMLGQREGVAGMVTAKYTF